jgi:O-antigen/teichoic acid export membrane protein
MTAPERPPPALPPVSLKRNIAANYTGQAFASLLSLALVPAYIRYLGMEAYALVGLFAVVQAWLTMLDLGMTPTLAREMARYTAGTKPLQEIRDLLRSLEIIYLGLATLVALALTFGARAIAGQWLNLEKLPFATVAGALSLLGIVVALRFCEGIYRAGITGLQQQVWLNAQSIAISLLRSLGALAVLALVSPTIQAFFVWQGLVSLVSLLVLALRLHGQLPRSPDRPRFSPAALRAVRGFAGGVFGVTVTSTMLLQIDKLMLSRMVGLEDLGHYMLASTLATGLYLVGGPVVIAVAPALVRLTEAGAREQLAATYHKAAQLVTTTVGPVALLMIIFPYGLLFAWTGDPALSGRTGPILSLLAIGTLLAALYQVPWQLQAAAGWTSMWLKLLLAGLALLVLLIALLVPRFGPLGASTAWGVANLVIITIGMTLLHRRLLPGERRRWLVGDTLAPLSGAVLVMALALLVQPQAMAGRLVWLGFVAVTGIAALVAAVLMADTLRDRLLALVRRAGR